MDKMKFYFNFGSAMNLMDHYPGRWRTGDRRPKVLFRVFISTDNISRELAIKLQDPVWSPIEGFDIPALIETSVFGLRSYQVYPFNLW